MTLVLVGFVLVWIIIGAVFRFSASGDQCCDLLPDNCGFMKLTTVLFATLFGVPLFVASVWLTAHLAGKKPILGEDL